ncbi:MAG: helix-turn-helix transcriptional regulator [Blastocatellia bacterium]
MKNETTNKSREHFRHIPRVFWIERQVQASRYPNTRTIADHFEITTKTAQRTLDYMRDQLYKPLKYSAEHRGWYYDEPTYGLALVELTEGELVTILLAEKLIRQHRGTALGAQVEQAFAKVLESLTDTISIDFNALTEAYSFEAGATSELDPALFSRLGRAAIECRVIEMTYFTATRGELTRRRAHPLHLRNYLGEWYLIAWDHLRGEPRDFHVGRIRELNVLDERFDWPAGFVLDDYLNAGFGMIRGREPVQIEIVFDEYQARWIRERGKVHQTEERDELPDGRLKLKMTVTALDGVKRFVLQYGAHVEVIRPEELRQSIQKELEAMQTTYNAR